MVDCLLLQIFTVCAILMFIEKSYYIFPFFRDILFETSNLRQHPLITVLDLRNLAISDSVYPPGLGSSTVDQVLKYTKYPKYIPSTSTGQVLFFFKST